MAGAAASTGTAAALMGFGGLLKEIVGEVGDLVQAILEQMDKVAIIDQDVEVTEYERSKGRLEEMTKTTHHYRVTLLHCFFIYCALRITGVLPPLVEWGAIFDNKPWYEVVLMMAAPVPAAVLAAASAAKDSAWGTKPHVPGRSDVPSSWIQ